MFCPTRRAKKGIISRTNTSVQRCLYPLFQNPPPQVFRCLLLSENHLNPQVKINKMVNKHTEHYHRSPSQLISRIHPFIFPCTFKGFISSESLNFFQNLYIPPWLWKSFKFIALRLLTNTSVRQKIESVHFYSWLQAKLSPRILSFSLRQKEVAHSSKQRFLNTFIVEQKR